MSCDSVTGHKDCHWSHSMVILWCHEFHCKMINCFFLYGSVWSIRWTVYDFHVSSTRDVCLYPKHILTNCVFLTVFPTIEDPFEPSFSFFSQFSSVFCHWSSSLLDFSILWKRFFVFFCWIILGHVGGHVLVVRLVTWVHKTHKLRAPKPQYNDLVFYSCRLHLQLTTMSDNLNFIKFHLLLQYGPYMVPG